MAKIVDYDSLTVVAIEKWLELKLMDIDCKRAYNAMTLSDYIKNDVYEELQEYINKIKAGDICAGKQSE